jgi:transforming growth factor-beta-induced protein
VLDVIRRTTDISNFAKLVADKNLVSVFTQQRGVTVFAPNNAALSDADTQALLADPSKLTLFLGRHLLIGARTLSGLGASVTTANGDVYPVDAVKKTIGPATIAIPDLQASNGVVHVITAVLAPSTTASTTASTATPAATTATTAETRTS